MTIKICCESVDAARRDLSIEVRVKAEGKVFNELKRSVIEGTRGLVSADLAGHDMQAIVSSYSLFPYDTAVWADFTLTETQS